MTVFLVCFEAIFCKNTKFGIAVPRITLARARRAMIERSVSLMGDTLVVNVTQISSRYITWYITTEAYRQPGFVSRSIIRYITG